MLKLTRNVFEKDLLKELNKIMFSTLLLNEAQMGTAYIWQYGSTRKSWEIGYVILSEFQGNGYCLESVNLLISFAFNELNAYKVIGMYHCDNVRSASVMQKAGMSKHGVFREEYKCGGKWVDQFYFSILEREYHKNYKES